MILVNLLFILLLLFIYHYDCYDNYYYEDNTINSQDNFNIYKCLLIAITTIAECLTTIIITYLSISILSIFFLVFPKLFAVACASLLLAL